MLLGACCFVVLDAKEIGEKVARKRLKMIRELKRFKVKKNSFGSAKRKSLSVSHI